MLQCMQASVRIDRGQLEGHLCSSQLTGERPGKDVTKSGTGADDVDPHMTFGHGNAQEVK